MDYRISHNGFPLSQAELFGIFDEYKHLPDEEKIAVFDFDNTLIHGDIGEAIFAEMLRNKKKIDFSWQEYNELISNGDTVVAYKKLISSYDGMDRDLVRFYSENVFNFNSSELEYISFIENGRFYSIPKPTVNKAMSDIILKLQSLGFGIYIISASSEISVKFIGNKLFDIPEENIFGMKNSTKPDNHRILDSNIELPAPCFDGKKELYLKYIGNKPPLITAGDSDNDIAFMNMTSTNGMKFIVKKFEDKQADYERKKQKMTDLFNDLKNIFTIDTKI